MGVTGIGGVFMRAKDPKALGAWYAEHLGVGGGEWGMWEQSAGATVFSPFTLTSDYFAANRQFMLNFRVEGLDALLDTLRAAGISIETKVEWDDPAVGKFARIHDLEGNPVELWEPAAKG